MERFRNYGLWIAAAALGYKVLVAAGVHITADDYNSWVQSALNLLILSGIINNPSIGYGYFDR